MARNQAFAALFSLAAMASVCLALGFAVRSKALLQRLDLKKEDSCRQTRGLLSHSQWFQTPDEPWIYDLPPKPDFSKGGVVFIGPSEVEYSTAFWKLRPELQELVHNFGVEAATPACESLLLRYLIENRGLVRAGGEKTLVVFGATYQPLHYEQAVNPFWIDCWTRYGFYEVDPEAGIRPASLNPISRFIRLEEMLQAGCLKQLTDAFAEKARRWRHRGSEPIRRLDPAGYIALRRSQMGPNWRAKIQNAMPAVANNIESLRARGVEVRVVLMPQSSWESQLPYSGEYYKDLRSLCEMKHVPLSDWSKMLEDDDFADTLSHPNIYGMEKIQTALLDLAVPFLESTHALREGTAGGLEANRMRTE